MSGYGLAPTVTCTQGFGKASASSTTAPGGPGQWANLTTGTGSSGFALNQGFSKATTSGASAAGDLGQLASLTRGAGINEVGGQVGVGSPPLPPPTGLPLVGVQPLAPDTGSVTAPGANVPPCPQNVEQIIYMYVDHVKRTLFFMLTTC